jgi:hypothetical protein
LNLFVQSLYQTSMYWRLRRIHSLISIIRCWCNFQKLQIQWISTWFCMCEINIFINISFLCMLHNIFHCENIQTFFIMFNQLSLKCFSFIDSIIEFLDHVLVLDFIMRYVVFIDSIISFNKIRIIRKSMKFRKIEMIFFDFLHYWTNLTKHFFKEIYSI